jgi:hypothetical protein
MSLIIGGMQKDTETIECGCSFYFYSRKLKLKKCYGRSSDLHHFVSSSHPQKNSDIAETKPKLILLLMLTAAGTVQDSHLIPFSLIVVAIKP